MQKIKYVLFALIIATSTFFTQESTQLLLPIKSTGVAEFLAEHPEFDGRGTIIFIFDTGVDMGIDGLTLNSTGETKVIDVQDFTGQGDVKFYEAEIDEENDKYFFQNEEMKFKVFGAKNLSIKASDEKYFIGNLSEKLWKNSSSGIKDLNKNKSEEDNFYFVVFQESEGKWVIFVDINGNGDLSDEKPMRNYKVAQDIFKISEGNKLSDFTIAVNIFPEESKISFFFDDGGHGTHCAGIAAGYKIGGQELNGVAPGANVIGLKLGNNNYAGGATVTESMKKCFDYADKISKEQEKPCIINMSFGVGSEIEGRAEMEKYINKIVDENPYLYVCTSNGNEGPGISTTGLPAALPKIFSSGAVLAEEVGQNLYGTFQQRDVLTYFSSRGGEVMKPDVVSPGASVSTIPNFMTRDVMWGTSMASPYSTGVMSLLLSAMKSQFPDIKIPSTLLFEAVRQSAVHLDGYQRIDEGSGLINVKNACELLKSWVKNDVIKSYETYTTSAFASSMPDEKSQALYIRNGNYVTDKDSYAFTITRNNFQKNDKFYRMYNVKSDAEWLIPIQKNLHLRNNQNGTVNVRFDKSKMQNPGIYNATISATRADKSNFPEFELMATIILPYEFTSENGYKHSWKNEKVDISMHKRYFVNVPAGASSMNVKLNTVDNQYGFVWFLVHQPDGQQIESEVVRGNGEVASVNEYYFNLHPGVYEVDVLGFFKAEGESTYDLSIQFDGVNRIEDTEITENKNYIELVNNFSKPKNYTLEGEISGYQKTYVLEINAGEISKIPFTLTPGMGSKSFSLTIEKTDFNKLTDFPINIYNKDGENVESAGFSYAHSELAITNNSKEAEEFLFELNPAFALKEGKIKVFVTESTFLIEKINLNPTFAKKNQITLYPSMQKRVELSVKKPSTEIQIDEQFFGNFKLKSQEKTVLEIPLKFKF